MKTYTIHLKAGSKIMYLITILLLVLCQKIFAQDTEHAHDHQQGKCITDEQRTVMEKRISENIARLKAKGKLKQLKSNEDPPEFSWPLKAKPQLEYNNYYYILNYVDQVSGSGKGDYNCGTRTYNGHKGIDILTWPYPWHIYDNDYVEVVAAAAGTIVDKVSNQFDQNCSITGSWNVVVIQHADGSKAYYGHLKKNSLTNKGIEDTVERGEYLGLVASSGQSTNPHLHFEVYDKNSNLIEPFSGGTCNGFNADSWWLDEQDYREPTFNALLTHSASPQQFLCKSDEKPYLSNRFSPGQTVYVGAYFRDYPKNDVSNYRIKRPNGTLWDNWTYKAPSTKSKREVVWTKSIPSSEAHGMWTVEVDYRGETFSHRFYYGTGCPPKNLKPYEILPFATTSGQDVGTASLHDDNTTIKLQNNAWKAIEVDYNITPNTVISFDFKSTIQGEIHGIGFANNTTGYNRDETFRLYGTQPWGDDSFYDYAGDGSYQRFVIPVGEFYTGQFKYLFFLCDKDASPNSSNSYFSNIKIFEDNNGDGICGIDNSGIDNSCPDINFNNFPVSGHAGAQDEGTAAIRDGGATLELNNNAWKSIVVNYNITPNTVISFDFKSTIQGQIQGIYFDNNTTLTNDPDKDRAFRVYGTQIWGNSDFDTYSGSGNYESFTIPIGQFYTGQFKYLVFMDDDDDIPENANAFFSNVKIYENGQCDDPVTPPGGNTCEALKNNTFDSNTNDWQKWKCSTSVSGGTLNITNIIGGTTVWNAGFKQNNVSLDQDKTYTLSMDARADNDRSVILRVMLDESPWTSYIQKTINLNSGVMQTHDFDFTVNTASTQKAKVELMLGGNNTNVRVDHISLKSACNNKEDVTSAPDIQLHPNPATHTIHIEYELPQNTSANIAVFDAFGKLVKNVSDVELLAGQQTLDMNVSDLAAGMYFYTLQSNEWKATKKFIITK